MKKLFNNKIILICFAVLLLAAALIILNLDDRSEIVTADEKIMKKLFSNKIIQICLAVLLLTAVLIVPGLDKQLKIVIYEINSEKIHSRVRLAVVSDLHSCYYGDEQKTLVDAINAQQPDIIVYIGDIFDDKIPNENTVSLLKALQGQYPSYYVTGNHEYWSYKSDQMIAIMGQYDVKVLAGEWETLFINDQMVNICGVDDPDVDKYTTPARSYQTQLQSLEKAAGNGGYTILLAHRPERFNEYTHYAFDLVLSGHAHGGQWRVPGLINGVFAPNQGLFPRYAGGQYERGTMTMIVSRGLAKETTFVPRIYNKPELVIVDLIDEGYS
jgi:predicted MPP superfamily phosphohydrolase